MGSIEHKSTLVQGFCRYRPQGKSVKDCLPLVHSRKSQVSGIMDAGYSLFRLYPYTKNSKYIHLNKLTLASDSCQFGFPIIQNFLSYLDYSRTCIKHSWNCQLFSIFTINSVWPLPVNCSIWSHSNIKEVFTNIMVILTILTKNIF